MKALVLEDRKTLAIRDVAVPELGKGDVLVRVEAAAICGSDLHRYVRGHRMYPLIMGHEAAGEIVAAGPEADTELVGRRAAIIPLLPCHACSRCAAGLFSLCRAYSFVGSRQAGAYAEYVCIPARNALSLPDDMPVEIGALLEPATIGRHMVGMASDVEGAPTVVFGCGSIGLMVIRWLRLMRSHPIIAVDPVAANREAAIQMGADGAIDPTVDDPAGAVFNIATDGAHAVFEASGSPIALRQSVSVAGPRATVVLGGNQPVDAVLPLAVVEDLMRREARLVGSFMSYAAPWPGGDWTDAVREESQGHLGLRAFISDELPLSDAPAVFEEIASGRLAHLKVIFRPGA